MKKLLIQVTFSIGLGLVLLMPSYVVAQTNPPPVGLPAPPITPCASGYHLDPTGTCVPDTAPGTPGTPVPPVTSCAAGYHLDTNGKCVADNPGNKAGNTGGGSGTGSGSGSSIDCPADYNNSTGLCLPNNPLGGPANSIVNSGNITQLAARVIDILLYFAGIVAVVFVVIGGYKYMTAGGNEESAAKGRKTMTQAIIGLVIVILAFVIITAVTNFLVK